LILQTNQLPRDTPYVVYFSDTKAPRSNKQLRFLWGYVYKAISDHTGYSAEEIHELCKAKFMLRMKFDLGEGGVEEVPKSTTMLNTAQMADFITKVMKWAIETLSVQLLPEQSLTDEHFVESREWLD
jgi:hypothetical protein